MRADAGLDPASMRAALAAIEPSALADPSAVRVVRAPGRVNLIGEHTDYNEGLVLPAAIDLEIHIAYLPTDDRRVEMTLEATGESRGFDLDAIPPRRGSWIDYVAGTAWALQAAGAATHGFRGLLRSNLPQSAGLSSSAALELASAWALAGNRAPELDGVSLARAAQRGENEYVGVQSGLMDQFAATFGVSGGALRLDCRSLSWDVVRLPDDLCMVVCHSGAPRTLVKSAYNERRAECARAVVEIGGILGPLQPIRSLRDVDPTLFAAIVGELEVADPIAARRADHVIHENARVDATVAAFRTLDEEALADLFAASHESLRSKFEVSSMPLDTLVDIARGTAGVVAARLTGAGFGGCTVNLVRRGAAGDLRAAVERVYTRRTGLEPRFFVVEAADGAGLIDSR